MVDYQHDLAVASPLTTHGTAGLEGPRKCLNGCERARLLPVFNPRPVQPVGSISTD